MTNSGHDYAADPEGYLEGSCGEGPIFCGVCWRCQLEGDSELYVHKIPIGGDDDIP